jgi:DNA replication protein DnaC
MSVAASDLSPLLHPAIDLRCKACKAEGFVIGLDPDGGPFAVARQCSCVKTCPTCRDSHWTSRATEPTSTPLGTALSAKRASLGVSYEGLARWISGRLPQGEIGASYLERVELGLQRPSPTFAVLIGEWLGWSGDQVLAGAAPPVPFRGKGRAMRRCDCTLLDDRIALFNAARIPARHRHCSYGTWNMKGKAPSAAMTRVRTWGREFRKATAEPDREARGLLLWGAPGLGKTHLMIALIRDLVFNQGLSVRFVEFSHLMQELKNAIEHKEGTADLLKELQLVDVLAVDEIGKGRVSPYDLQMIDLLVSSRYDAWRPILATTNYEPKPATGRALPELASASEAVDTDTPGDRQPALVDRVGERVFSRLQEMCEFYGVTGQSYRHRIHFGDI